MTKTEIIEETAAFYNNANRSYGKENLMCYYQHPDNPKVKCAVGRCMTVEGIGRYGAVLSSLPYLLDKRNLDDILQEKYKGHSFGFWEDLQTFHDDHNYWSIGGLSLEGQEQKELLIKKYSV